MIFDSGFFKRFIDIFVNKNLEIKEMNNLAFLIVMNSKNEPLFSQVLESETISLEFEMMIFSSLDQFNSLSKHTVP